MKNKEHRTKNKERELVRNRISFGEIASDSGLKDHSQANLCHSLWNKASAQGQEDNSLANRTSSLGKQGNSLSNFCHSIGNKASAQGQEDDSNKNIQYSDKKNNIKTEGRNRPVASSSQLAAAKNDEYRLTVEDLRSSHTSKLRVETKNRTEIQNKLIARSSQLAAKNMRKPKINSLLEMLLFRGDIRRLTDRGVTVANRLKQTIAYET